MTNKQLNDKINALSIRSRKMIIDNIGLKKQSREILISKYIDELSIAEMCEKFGYEERNLGKKIANAKKEMNTIIEKEYKFMDDDLKDYIKLLIE